MKENFCSKCGSRLQYKGDLQMEITNDEEFKDEVKDISKTLNALLLSDLNNKKDVKDTIEWMESSIGLSGLKSYLERKLVEITKDFI